jgi:hypothetical protein
MCDCQELKSTRHEGEPKDQLWSEIQKIGRETFLRRISSTARKALSQMPEQDEIEKLDGES